MTPPTPPRLELELGVSGSMQVLVDPHNRDAFLRPHNNGAPNPEGHAMCTAYTLDVSSPPLAYSISCLLYTSPSPRDGLLSRMPSSA